MKYSTVDIYVLLERLTEEVGEINENVHILLNKKLGTQTRKPVPEETATIDRGKVLALRKAGWSYSRIADEMECSKSAIANIIRKDKNDE